MSIPGADDDLAALHAEFAEEVVYTGAGLSGQPIPAVPMNTAAAGFMGSAGSLRTKAFEIRQAVLPAEPANWDELETDDGTVWRVIEVQPRDDVGAWVLLLEHAE